MFIVHWKSFFHPPIVGHKKPSREYQDLINANEMRVIVTQIRRGSVIIEFDLLTNVRINLQTSNVQKNIINALNASSLDVDLNQTTVRGK